MTDLTMDTVPPAPMPAGKPAVAAAPDVVMTDLVVAYERHPAVHHLAGRFAAGSLTAIIGPNGGGKSTLLKTIVGVQPITSGRLDLGGLTRHDIAYMPQHAEIDRTIPISILELVCTGFLARLGPFAAIGRRLREEAREALRMVGMSGFENRLIDSVSVGQFQRALFARVLVQKARMILLDEPFAAVDQPTTSDLVALVAHWHREGRTVILVTHDLELARQHIPETLLLAREPIAWGPTDKVLVPELLARARHRSQAWDETAGACHIAPVATPDTGMSA